MRLAVVARFSTNGEAGAAISALEAAGIESVQADENIVAWDWRYSNGVGGVKVVVRDADLEAAADVLFLTAEEPGADDEGSQAAESAPETVPAEDALGSCPACGNLEAARTPRLRLFVFISVVLGGVGVAVGQSELAIAAVLATALITAMVPSHRCTKCGERWSAGDRQSTGDDRTAPLPDVRDTIEERCRWCGSANIFSVDHQRLKAITMLIPGAIIVVLLVWPFLPKRHCQDCGRNA
jgi:predicted nucleic acid-binding Zn ribbon protein/predicted RNA-binding Zn-ribbon protein involved in translation (DUF1610 family)